MEKTATISAENTFTGGLCPTADVTFSDPRYGYMNLSLSGTWDATVVLQRSFDNGVTWLDVETFSANTEKSVFDPEYGVLYRLGVKTGGFTSGNIAARLSK